ncbi:transcriptional regulator [Candidatus Shapirobacteria bacterium CG08_land_8_20_14_0_20_39_18]|uniref:Transcriptional regulator n=1 Tax=Candidatus Shapirobacteria bacterium CG08_land_8_20_14_0_20_39_18 TaxID=1974883 RepID=A0A2M6XCN7_9BACT|nr:MAG: transcriptional regulator [Candidatus Shapirobacteria bacterium CG08_land_8_20_14_0_20_39_18]PIY65080.1 MAG: transcriptional regulator [Candidatus Shapirobacteria bacterium CG_4_10_14_0_8_um_filter_39_15]
MRNKLYYTFEDHLKESLKDPEFRKVWKDSELEYKLACQLIEKRLAKKMSQRDLAKKVKTTQAVISRLETMNENPSLSLLKRIAQALGTKINLQIE